MSCHINISNLTLYHNKQCNEYSMSPPSFFYMLLFGGSQLLPKCFNTVELPTLNILY